MGKGAACALGSIPACGLMEINAHTHFFGVIGNPVDHSLSPAIHNAAFKELGLDCVYLAWKVEAIGDAIKGLRALGNFRGASVTLPHKVAAIPFLDHVETTAGRIGAINTIVVEESRLVGYNTDATGALRALRDGNAPLKDESIVILGSGGAARAIAFGLAAEARIRRVQLLGIEDAERRILAEDLKAKTDLSVADGFLDEASLKRALPEARVLIHCTPVGMAPKVGKSCVPVQLLHPELTVMDVVYNPRETRLLADARTVGCRTIAGLEMFLYQAAAQFELWMNRAAPIDVMRRVVESRFL